MDLTSFDGHRAPRVVIVGAGSAGFHAARRLARPTHGRSHPEIILINPTDYFLYLPLLPEVTAGILDARRICVPLTVLGPAVRLVLGTVTGIDLDGRQVTLNDPDGVRRTVAYDRLVITVGSVRSPRDAVAVPDLTRPGKLTAMTAQHAVRQGRCAAANVAASLGMGRRAAYRHHTLGFAVDLAGAQATASPANVPVSGVMAKVLTGATTWARSRRTASGSPPTGLWTPWLPARWSGTGQTVCLPRSQDHDRAIVASSERSKPCPSSSTSTA